MKYYLAPMEGITGYLFRRIHHEMFPGMDKYFMPFMAPHLDGTIKHRDERNILPENNEGIYAVPQVLTNDAGNFKILSARVREMGYPELNLNLGCPYQTVVSKGKGSGFLERTEQLEACLDAIFSNTERPEISIKTRLGATESTLQASFALYERYPVYELTIHPRRQKDMYRGVPDMEAFDRLLARSRHAVCYNGNLFTPGQIKEFADSHPAVDAVMLGRGLLRNPALVRYMQSGEPLRIHELKAFHDRLYEAYSMEFSGPTPVLGHMKELWVYWETGMHVDVKLKKTMYKAKTCREYEKAASAVFADAELMNADELPMHTKRLQL